MDLGGPPVLLTGQTPCVSGERRREIETLRFPPRTWLTRLRCSNTLLFWLRQSNRWLHSSTHTHIHTRTHDHVQEMTNCHTSCDPKADEQAACQGPYRIASEEASVCHIVGRSAVHLGMCCGSVGCVGCCGLCGRRRQSRNKRRYLRVRNSCSPADTIRWWERFLGAR